VHLISLDDIPREDLADIVAGRRVDVPAGRFIVLLDWLPLGAAELALRAAAARVGAEVVSARRLFPGFDDGADLLETAAVAGAYADVLVVRHPLRGAARAAAAVSRAPVLSAGDGGGEDPLFALGDLAVFGELLGDLRGRSLALCGDLGRNRRAHSIAGGLLGLRARVLLVPALGSEPEEGFLDRLSIRHGYHPVRFAAQSMSSLLDMVDSWLLTPDLEHQLPLLPDVDASSDQDRRQVRRQVRDVDALWVASPRDDRGEPIPASAPPRFPFREEDGRALVSLRPSGSESALPLFRRAEREVGAVAALLSRSLAGGLRGSPVLPEGAYTGREGVRCDNAACVACREPARVTPAFTVLRTDPLLLACVYCWARRRVQYVGSRVEKRYHRLGSSQVRKILPRNVVFFSGRREAESAGFVLSRLEQG
jgi:hypothetical protein